MDTQKPTVALTPREVTEINFAMEYAHEFRHGTDGHSRLILIAKLAEALGFAQDSQIPPNVVITENEIRR